MSSPPEAPSALLAPVPVPHASARFASFEMLGAALLFAVMALLTKRATTRLPGPEIAFVRFAVGLATVLPSVLKGRLRWNNVRGLTLRGLFGGIAVLLYFLTIEHLSVGLATLFNYTAPVFTALWAAVFLGERLTVRVGIALALTLTGVALIVLGNGAIGLGDGVWYATGIASAVVSGAAVAAIRSVRKTDGPVEIFAAFCAGGALLTLPPTLAHIVVPTLEEGLLLLVIGLVSAVAQLAMTHAYRYVRAAAGGIILQMTPVFTLLMGVLLFHEPLTLSAGVGATITLTGLVLATRG